MDYKLFVVTSSLSLSILKTDVIGFRTVGDAERAYEALCATSSRASFEITVTKLY